MIKFIGYKKTCNSLCSGMVLLEVDGILYTIDNCLISGGSVSFDKNWNPSIEKGFWSINKKSFKKNIPNLKDDDFEYIEFLINKNVEKGCCGACI